MNGTLPYIASLQQYDEQNAKRVLLEMEKELLDASEAPSRCSQLLLNITCDYKHFCM